MMKPLRTGGVLNVINEKYGCNNPNTTVRTTAIAAAHRPQSAATMLALLDSHTEARCSACGQQCRNGGLVAWTQVLYNMTRMEVQRGNCAARAVTMQDCGNFMYDLFVRAPVRGFAMEVRALQALTQAAGHVAFTHATPDQDVEFAVDLVSPTCGIQVKPESYKHVREDVHHTNARKNKAYGKPVHYLYYGSDGAWSNLDSVVASLEAAEPSPPVEPSGTLPSVDLF